MGIAGSLAGKRVVISLDGGAAPDVRTCAHAFEFPYGTVEVVERDQRLGLREHILWCGDQTGRFGSVIVLEDDLLVDPWFYVYAQHALAAYTVMDSIAGIALFSPKYNDYAHLPFEPLVSGSSAYFMQVPCSSGQAWTAAQWQAFRTWYADADERNVLADAAIPAEVLRWSKRSWKKYFVAYLAATGRSFVYPYQAYTTNCGDPGGTHWIRGSDLHQVPLADPGRDFAQPDLPRPDSTAVFYDLYMEPRLGIDFASLGLTEGSVCVDLYGSKPRAQLEACDYCLTTRPVRSSLASFPLSFRPLPLNVLLVGERSDSGAIRLCRPDQLYEREPLIAGAAAKFGLRWYFLTGPKSGLSLIVFGLYALLRRHWPKWPAA
jgi:hypothetical protein